MDKKYEERYKRMKEELDKAKKSHENGILMSYKVRHMKDGRVCSKCEKFDGYATSVIEAVIGVNHPPFHEGCRCLAIYSITEIKK